MDALTSTEKIIGILISLTVLLAAAKPVWNWLKERRGRSSLELEVVKFDMQWLADQDYIPVFKMDADLNMVFANKAYCKLLSVDCSQLLSRGWFDTLKTDEKYIVIKRWRDAVEHKANFSNMQWLFLGREFRRFHVIADVFIYKGKVRGYTGTVRAVEPSLMKGDESTK